MASSKKNKSKKAYKDPYNPFNKSERKEIKELKEAYKEASVPLEKSDKGNALTKGIKKIYRKLRHSKLNQKLSNRTNDDLRANKVKKQSANNIVDKLKLDIELGSSSVVDKFIDKAKTLKAKMNSLDDVKQTAFQRETIIQAKAIKTNLEQMKSVLYNSIINKSKSEKSNKPTQQYLDDFFENPKNDKFMQKYKALENNITLVNSLLKEFGIKVESNTISQNPRIRSNAVSHQNKPKEIYFEISDSESLDLNSSPFEDVSKSRNRSNAFSKQEKPKETAFELSDSEALNLNDSPFENVSKSRNRSNAFSKQEKPKETAFELSDSEALNLNDSPFENVSKSRNRSNAFSKQEKPKETAFEIKDPEPLSFGDSPSETKPKTWTKGVTNKTQELIQKFEQKNAKTSEKISEPNLDDEISKMFKFSKSKDLEQATEALKPKNMEKAAKNTKPKIGIRGNKSFGITD